jgi:hypothetical protein
MTNRNIRALTMWGELDSIEVKNSHRCINRLGRVDRIISNSIIGKIWNTSRREWNQANGAPSWKK